MLGLIACRLCFLKTRSYSQSPLLGSRGLKKASCQVVLDFSLELSLWLRSNHSGLLPCLSWISTDNAFAPHRLYYVQQHFARQHAGAQVKVTHLLQEPVLRTDKADKSWGGGGSQRGGVTPQGQNRNSGVKKLTESLAACDLLQGPCQRDAVVTSRGG